MASLIIARIVGGEAGAILYGFIEKLEQRRDIFNHEPRGLTYSPATTLAYEGTLVRSSGAEASLFRVVNDDFFAMIYVPDSAEFEPIIEVYGDQSEAMKFFLAFRMAGGEWV